MSKPAFAACRMFAVAQLGAQDPPNEARSDPLGFAANGKPSLVPAVYQLSMDGARYSGYGIYVRHNGSTAVQSGAPSRGRGAVGTRSRRRSRLRTSWLFHHDLHAWMGTGRSNFRSLGRPLGPREDDGLHHSALFRVYGLKLLLACPVGF